MELHPERLAQQDRYMFNRKKLGQVFGGLVVGCLALGMVGYWFAIDRVSQERSAGLLIGLCAGFTSVIADHVRKGTKGNSTLRIVSIILSPIGLFALLPFSVDLAGGYFLGSSANFAFARALASLFEDPTQCDT